MGDRRVIIKRMSNSGGDDFSRAATQRRRTGVSFEDMAARRAERLVNLVFCLLSTRQYLGAERIRDAVPGYEAADGTHATDEAFKRMFERDKSELRELGIPLETGRNSGFDAEDGYRISRREYELPPIEFDAAEAAAVGLAGRLWQSATLGAAARSALLKLRAAGTDITTDGTPGSVPHLDASDPSLPALLDAARAARPVHFDYRKRDDPAPLRRTLEPWGVLSWRGRWYVAGHDRDRGEPRSFRLSRITGRVQPFGTPGEFTRPEQVNLLEMVAGRNEDAHVARVRVTGPGAGALRRLADSVVEETAELVIGYNDVDWLARRVAAAGSSVRVLTPPELVDAVVARLRVAAGAGS
jgi:proteasome accessory factor B